jgi:hypothetical protein
MNMVMPSFAMDQRLWPRFGSSALSGLIHKIQTDDAILPPLRDRAVKAAV